MTARAGLRPIQRISRRGLISSGLFAGLLLASGLPVAARAGGVLRLALAGADASDTWDPRGHKGLFMQVAGQGAAFECLTEITASGEIAGEIAESWESDASAKIWRFDLRAGAMFHDGQPVLAEDVIASLSHLEDVEALRALSPRQVEIALHFGNADLPFLLAEPQYTIAPKGDFSRGIGSGLYRVDQFEPGVSARLSRVSQHWRDGTAGWFSALELTAAGPQSLAAFAQGAFDALGDVPASQISDLPKAHILVSAGYRKWVADLPPEWRSVRADLAQSLPRSAFAGTAGEVSPDHPLTPRHLHASVELPAQTPALLPALIAQGFDPSLLKWQVFEGGFTADAALRAAFAGPLKEMTKDAALMADVRAARASFDTAERRKLYAGIQARIAAEGPALWPATVPIYDVHGAQLARPAQVSQLLPLDGARIAQRWWFA